jgi:hypothetical protein
MYRVTRCRTKLFESNSLQIAREQGPRSVLVFIAFNDDLLTDFNSPLYSFQKNRFPYGDRVMRFITSFSRNFSPGCALILHFVLNLVSTVLPVLLFHISHRCERF